MIEPEHPALPIARQCELLRLARARYDHRPHSAFGDAAPLTPMEVYRVQVPLAINQ